MNLVTGINATSEFSDVCVDGPILSSMKFVYEEAGA